jgi:hypothetical protein
MEMLKGHAMIKKFKIPPEINFHLIKSIENCKRCKFWTFLDCLPSQAIQAQWFSEHLKSKGLHIVDHCFSHLFMSFMPKLNFGKNLFYTFDVKNTPSFAYFIIL